MTKPKTIIITGVTLTGNLGGVAMSESIRDLCEAKGINVSIASILPKADEKSAIAQHYKIIPLPYKAFLLFTAPFFLAIALLPLPSKLKRWLAKLSFSGRHFASADAIIDLSGIAFVDKRGVALLWYNTALLLPGLVLSIPTYKMSQALGPFNGALNQRVAKWALNKAAWVYCRGRKSFDNCLTLGVERCSYAPDVSFSLQSENLKQTASEIVNNAANLSKPSKRVVICPSKVVQDYCSHKNISLVQELASYIEAQQEEGNSVFLMPHSEDSGIGKNNDLGLCIAIQKTVENKLGASCPIIDPKGSPRLAREVIGLADLAITCRFHSLIAALASATPAITIGWNHKYQEAAAPFNIEHFVIDYENMTCNSLLKHTGAAFSQASSLAEQMMLSSIKTKQYATTAINDTLEKILKHE